MFDTCGCGRLKNMSLLNYFKRKRDLESGDELDESSHINKCEKLTESNLSTSGCKSTISNDGSVNVIAHSHAHSSRSGYYPKDKHGRCFREEWLKKFDWLEYSSDLDRVFCRACKTYQPTGTKEMAFISMGYNCWKKALDKKRGFPAHETTTNHLVAVSKLKDKQLREQKDQSVSTLVNKNVLEENRYYLTSIVQMIQFLVSNELPFRGTYEGTSEDGLFMSFYEYTLTKDSKLEEIAKRIPKNASYLSPKIQNDLIDLIADTVRNDISENIRNADIPWYTLFMDGTRNKNMEESIAFGIRYVKNGKVKEQTLSLEVSKRCDAQSLAQLALDLLNKCNLDPSNLLSQCYDGASVMSGNKGGVQGVIQQKLGRKIPYVHCYNHKLHLVIIEIMIVDEVQHFFKQCTMLYNFLKKGNVQYLYEGKSLVRLLEQRWSGHYDVVLIIYDNFTLIIDCLISVQNNENRRFDGEDIAVSTGLLFSIVDDLFCFCLVFMKKLLGILQPADKILQKRETNLKMANDIVNVVSQSLISLRSDNEFDSIFKEGQNINKNISFTKRKQRIRKKSTALRDHIVYEHINEPSVIDERQRLNSIYNETIDIVLQELDRRFTDNGELILAITAVEELNINTKNYDFLKNLGVKIPQKEEIIIAKNYLNSNVERGKDYFGNLYKMKEAFPLVYDLVATSRVFGCSTAICESTFSVLTRIDRPQRRCMTSQRQSNLVLLNFEKNMTENIDMNGFLKKFNEKVRKLQLF